MLLAVYLHEDFLDVERVAAVAVRSLQPAGIYGSELDAPQADRFSGYSDAFFCEQIFDIAMT
jgi:hypothetical protein